MPPGMSSDQKKSSSPPTMVEKPPTSRRRGSRRNKGPKPWLVLKLSVAFAVGIIAYTGYVYIAKLCIPMIKREHRSLGSRRLGSESQCDPSPLPFLSLFASCDLILRWRLYSDGLSDIDPRIPWVISNFLGRFCRGWDDDDLGVHQGAYPVVPLPITPSSHPLYPNAQRVCSYVNPCLGWVGDWLGLIYSTRLRYQGEFHPCPSVYLVLCTRALSSSSSSTCCVS